MRSAAAGSSEAEVRLLPTPPSPIDRWVVAWFESRIGHQVVVADGRRYLGSIPRAGTMYLTQTKLAWATLAVVASQSLGQMLEIVHNITIAKVDFDQHIFDSALLGVPCGLR